MNVMVTVTIAVAGAVEPEGIDAIVRELVREVVDVVVAPIETVLAGNGERSVLLLWAPAGINEALCGRVVSWADARTPRPGLVGCAPAGTHVDAETALAAGFDDAVVGGCSTRELAARIRAVHRGLHWHRLRRPGRLRHGGLLLDTDGHELWLDGRSVSLTGTELSVVRALMRARGRTLTRTELLDNAWGSANFEISERAVDNVVLRLRRKLGRPELIKTVRGVGFRLDTPGSAADE